MGEAIVGWRSCGGENYKMLEEHINVSFLYKDIFTDNFNGICIKMIFWKFEVYSMYSFLKRDRYARKDDDFMVLWENKENNKNDLWPLLSELLECTIT